MNRPKDWYDSCKSCKLEYVLHGLDTLEDWVLTWHGVRMAWHRWDAKAVDAGAMTEEEYIRRNRLAELE